MSIYQNLCKIIKKKVSMEKLKRLEALILESGNSEMIQNLLSFRNLMLFSK